MPRPKKVDVQETQVDAPKREKMPKHEVLARVDEAHRKGLRPSLAGLDISGIDFSGKDFHVVDFSNADMSGCDFSHANMQGCKFTGAIMDGTNFEKADKRWSVE